MSKGTIREFMGDYALDVEPFNGHKITLYFNSRRNAETVKRCIEVDDSRPNAATAVDFVEVVRCKDCKYWGGVTSGAVCRKYSGCDTRYAVILSDNSLFENILH